MKTMRAIGLMLSVWYHLPHKCAFAESKVVGLKETSCLFSQNVLLM